MSSSILNFFCLDAALVCLKIYCLLYCCIRTQGKCYVISKNFLPNNVKMFTLFGFIRRLITDTWHHPSPLAPPNFENCMQAEKKTKDQFLLKGFYKVKKNFIRRPQQLMNHVTPFSAVGIKYYLTEQ